MTVKIVEIELVTPELRPMGDSKFVRAEVSKHIFRLGHGVCGREITQLQVFPESYGLEIEQWCEDNPEEPDYFGYPWHQIKRWKVYHTDEPNPAGVKQ